eukprot:m.91134 g.91134  ORF g.91134 m.91134 type:complete len:223 (-) comp26448_c0_seq1:169-837(-)
MLSRSVSMAMVLRRPLVPVVRAQANRFCQKSTIRTAAPLRSEVAATAPVAVEGYTKALKYLHWGVGGGILAIFATVNIAQQTKDKKLKGKMMNAHKSIALLTTGGIIARIAVRLTSKIPLAMPNPPILKMGSALVHTVLYGFMIVMPASGIAMGYFGGKGLPFFGMTIPGATEKNGEIAKNAFKVHKFLGIYFEAFVAMHAAGAFFHLARGHTIFARMNPFI